MSKSDSNDQIGIIFDYEPDKNIFKKYDKSQYNSKNDLELSTISKNNNGNVSDLN